MSKREQIILGILISMIVITVISISVSIAEELGAFEGAATALLFGAAFMTLINSFWKFPEPWLGRTVMVILWVAGVVAGLFR